MINLQKVLNHFTQGEKKTKRLSWIMTLGKLSNTSKKKFQTHLIEGPDKLYTGLL